ncbi:MAG: DUF2760 domain-containing protein [Deltaproteobacteria bacterium]|nr:DUF2760 domain-containing protein [Deltaproteobacteria bacterium]
MHRIYLAFLCFFRVLFGKPLPEEVALPAPALTPALPPAAPAPSAVAPKAALPAPRAPVVDTSHGALQLLGMFQREGRLVDFLRESIDQHDDASIGMAVRDIHRGLRKVLDEHFTVEPAVDGDENDSFTVDPEFDPGRIRLVGNLVGKPPFQGILRHHGWRASKVHLPEITGAIDVRILAPAEVELA